MNVQPPTPERMEVSRRFMMLSLLYDTGCMEGFAEALKEFQEELTGCSLLAGGPVFCVRHLARADGRQRFVVFAGSEQFDCFDFSAPIVGGDAFGGDDDSDIDFGDPCFQPFDVDPRG